MNQMVELNFNPDTDTLRRFGFIALGGFGLLAVLAYTESLLFAFGLGGARTTVAGALAGVGVVSAFLSIVAPRANRAVFVGLSVLTFPIGFVVSHVIMGILFFLVITPIAIVFRIMGRDTLLRSYDEAATSYWIDAKPNRGNESYFKQY